MYVVFAYSYIEANLNAYLLHGHKIAVSFAFYIKTDQAI